MNGKDLIIDTFRLTPKQRAALLKLHLKTVRDLLYHFPTRYENISNIIRIKELKEGDEAIIYGRLEDLKTRKAFRSRRPIAEGYICDETGRMKIIWFNQPYIAKMYAVDVPVKVVGKVGGEKGKLYLPNPEVEQLPGLPLEGDDSLFQTNGTTETLFPIYPESTGITSKWFHHATKKVLVDEFLKTIDDPIPQEILNRYHLPSLQSALVWMHAPQNSNHAKSARKRFAFEEIFYIQLERWRDKNERIHKNAFRIDIEKKELQTFIDRFPFKATKAQLKAIDSIIKDLKSGHAMARLLEGDVGSGKTAVAASTVYAIATTSPLRADGTRQDFGRLQTAYMVPTEILAKQHFESFITFFEHMPINIGLITGSSCKKFPSKVDKTKATHISRAQLLKWIGNGEIPIVIGTHALIQKTVAFENLAYVIIDEQHRFGTMQRHELLRKDNIAPHLLSMTATPIPRTLALTMYGDLDLTVLDEMPAGRKPIVTEIVYPKERPLVYEKVRKELEAGRQVYVICPRIEEPDPEKEQALNVKSVVEESLRLKKDVFPEYKIEYLHSKMKPKEKEDTMRDFANNTTHILVATSVVEVGVNVPNATVIIIEGAERFGLAQLHQLRGRVLRSTNQAYCFVFADAKSKTTQERLRAFKTAKNGFELAEFDLSIRGGGELYGRNQSGLSDIGMEALKNIKMVEAARSEAEEMITTDPKLANHPLLKERAEEKRTHLHFE
ncbi:MAG TPA: ATP-dependent DNA helicase RecG [Candidatus Paceibacterota bacterium]